MAPKSEPHHIALQPNASRQHPTLRKRRVQLLTDLLHACLLRGEIQRATRAWAILVRCKEVDWRSRWQWGLALLNANSDSQPNTLSVGPGDNDRTEQWLRSLRPSAPGDEKPLLLHALILHMIRNARYREALEELETYLTSYPYILSGILHTYAGMIAFYLAQPASLRTGSSVQKSTALGETRDREGSGSLSPVPGGSGGTVPEPNLGMLRQARGWFTRAISIEPDEVAAEHIKLIDIALNGQSADDSDDDDIRPRAIPAVRQPSLESSDDEEDENHEDDEEEEEEEAIMPSALPSSILRPQPKRAHPTSLYNILNMVSSDEEDEESILGRSADEDLGEDDRMEQDDGW